MGFPEELAQGKAMAAGSSLQLQHFGRMWRTYVGLQENSGGPQRQQLIDAVNEVLDGVGLGLRVGRGFQAYDPVVRSGRAKSYPTLCGTFASQPDGGREIAGALLLWAGGHTNLTQLSDAARDFGVIVTFAEVGRGYSNSLSELFNHLNSIAVAGTPVQAAALWQMVPTSWTPATTYKQDNSATGLYV